MRMAYPPIDNWGYWLKHPNPTIQIEISRIRHQKSPPHDRGRTLTPYRVRDPSAPVSAGWRRCYRPSAGRAPRLVDPRWFRPPQPSSVPAAGCIRVRHRAGSGEPSGIIRLAEAALICFAGRRRSTTLLATVTRRGYRGALRAEKKSMSPNTLPTTLWCSAHRRPPRLFSAMTNGSRSRPELKTLEDATQLRRRILSAFEDADRRKRSAAGAPRAADLLSSSGAGRPAWKLAGTIGRVAHAPRPCRRTFATSTPQQCEASFLNRGRIAALLARLPRTTCPAMPQRSLESLGVEVAVGQPVTECSAEGVRLWRQETGSQNHHLGRRRAPAFPRAAEMALGARPTAPAG